MRRHFVQDPGVTNCFAANGVSDAELRSVENAIMRGEGVIISGTSGLKKIRCASAGRGKRGAVRLIFADYPRVGRTYMLAAFGKNEMANLSQRDRNTLQGLKKILDKAMEGLVQNEANEA